MIRTPDYMRVPPAWFHTRVLVGPGALLTPRFVYTHNITHVINCAFDKDCPDWFRMKHPNRYRCINAYDNDSVNILQWYPQFESALQTFLRDGEGIVYVHCQAGMNRSAFLALTYICKNFHCDVDDMVKATKRQRPVMFQNSVFMNQVKQLLNGCVQDSQNKGAIERNDGDRRNPRLVSQRGY